MKSIPVVKPVQLLLLGLVLLGAAGCAVLTSSQVKEVQSFAKTSEEYTELPGSLAKAYGAMLRDKKLLTVASREFGQKDASGGIDTTAANGAWSDIKDAYEQEQRLDEVGKQMDAALAVLDDYSQLLTRITSSEYTDELDASTTKLGEKLDDATKEFNNTYKQGNPLDLIGGNIGWAIRTAGGIFIRHKQYEILRDVTKTADPLVAGLMSAVEDIASNKMQAAFVNYEENFLGREFKSVANNSHRLEMGTVSFVYDDLARAKAGRDLAGRVATAARTYRDAHRRLVETTRIRMDLKQAIEEIQALKKEVDAGKKIKSAIKQ